MHAQPPGPGLPMHAPSVINWTFFRERLRFSGGCSGQLAFEEGIYVIEYLRRVRCFIDLHAKFRSIPNAVGEVSGELFHLAHGIALIPLAQHAVIRAHQIVALALTGIFVAPRCKILLYLPEDPGIGRSSAPDHPRVAARLLHHPNRILRGYDVAVADHGDVADGGFHFSDAGPIRFAAIALLASAGVQG